METRLSLLERAVSGDEATWRRLVAIYQPLIRGWLLAQGVVPQEADDLAQEVMAILVRELPKFDHAGRPGSFRARLRTISVNQARKFWRSGRCRVAGAAGGSFTLASLDELADSASDLAKAWDAEHDRHICLRLGPISFLVCIWAWIAAGVIFPVALDLTVHDLPLFFHLHFLASQTLCGLIAVSYPQFGLSLTAFRVDRAALEGATKD